MNLAPAFRPGNLRPVWLAGHLALVVGLCSGCSQRPPWETVYPVKGSLHYKGKPLAGALVTLVPVDPKVPASVRPSATTGQDGTFVLGTYSGADGAPAGEYKVLALHFPVGGTPENPSPRPNALPVKYAQAETTDLTVVVQQQPTELQPLQLN